MEIIIVDHPNKKIYSTMHEVEGKATTMLDAIRDNYTYSEVDRFKLNVMPELMGVRNCELYIKGNIVFVEIN